MTIKTQTFIRNGMMRGLGFAVGLVVVLLWATDASAQTGKITGTVVDAANGEALPGVNVFIEGTTQGTSTNIDGEYVIIGVRPGTYTVVASFVGFATQRKEGVQVSVDLTTTVDFRLQEQVIEGEEIVVTAEAERVRKDLTSSEARVTAETIDQLPATELDQVLDVQAGITTRNGLHIRGGRSSEVLFMVDGVPVSDSYDGSATVQLENEGIQELQVISGTFNAEYGNAMSGVVNVVTKEGRGDRLGGSFEAYSGAYTVAGDGGTAFLRGTEVDEFREAGIEYRDVDPYSYIPVEPGHYNNLKGTIEGPLGTDRLTIFALGRYFENDGWLYGARLFNIDGTAGDSSLVPMNTFEKFSWQGNLKFRLNRNMIVNLIGLGSFSEQDDLGIGNGRLLGYRWNPDGIPTLTDTGYNTKLKLTHFLGSRTFYTVNLATFFKKAESHLFEDPFDERYNDFTISPPDSVEVRPGEYQQVLTGGGRFLRGGTDLNRFERSTRSYLAKFDLSSQLGRHHLVKTGLQAKLDVLDFTSFSLIPATSESGERIEPFEPAIPDSTQSGFNHFEDVNPFQLSAYVQDKIEYENFIVNVGVRLDYFDARSKFPADPEDPNIYNPFKLINRFRDLDGDGVISDEEERPDNQMTVEDREAYWWEEPDPKVQVSPRLGVAYPITEEGVVHFSFGLFFQIPTLDNLFNNFGYKTPIQSGQYGPFGNPNLEAQKTTMYEIGFRQGLGDLVLDITAYNRDVRQWVSTSPLVETVLPGVTYVIFTNRDYANTRGVTLSLNKRFSNHYGFDASYTFQVVEGSNSNPADEFFALQANNQPKLQLLPLNWDQRHKVAGAIYGNYEGWNGSLRFRFESGFPYTPSFPEAALVGNDVQPEFPTNSRRIPSTFEVDLSLSRTFEFGGIEPRVFAEVFNLLDRRELTVTNVFSDTGEPDVTLEQQRTATFDPGFWVRPSHYREPRRIQVGMEFKF